MAAAAHGLLRRALGAALRADGMEALALLEQLDPGALTERDARLHGGMLQRLRAAQPALDGTPADSAAAAIVTAYRRYWHRHLRRELGAADNEARLLAALQAVLAQHAHPVPTTLEAAEAPLRALMGTRGYHALLGLTRPLRECMLWRDEREQRFTVELPEGLQDVRVVFLDGFASLGWAAYATCDRHYSGGWATRAALFIVERAYDLASERFRVSALAHEAQHFADYARFPGLADQGALEYRAKLAEIALARETLHDLLETFAANTSADPSMPHAHANARVVTELQAALGPGPVAADAWWRGLPPEHLNRAARAQLERDSAARSSR